LIDVSFVGTVGSFESGISTFAQAIFHALSLFRKHMALIDKVAHVVQFRAAMIRMVMAFEVAIVLYDVVEEAL